MTVRPDWLCEIVSESNRSVDTSRSCGAITKRAFRTNWIIDQLDRTLIVHRHTSEGYLVALRAEAHKHVHAEPFDAVESHVAVLLGDDPDDGGEPSLTATT